MSHALREWVSKTPRARTLLARAAGVRWQTVDDIIRGKHTPRVETARALARATGGAVSVAEILGLDEHDLIMSAPSGAGESAS